MLVLKPVSRWLEKKMTKRRQICVRNFLRDENMRKNLEFDVKMNQKMQEAKVN
jgi:hypothetical protein